MLTALLLAGAASLAIPSTGAALPNSEEQVAVTLLVAGEVDPNGILPAFNGVPPAGTYNWDVALPTSVLAVGHPYEFDMLANDENFSGPCKAFFELTQEQNGKKVILAKTVYFSGGCNPRTIYEGRSEWTIPNSPGRATLLGVISYGTKKSTMSVPMLIQ